MIETGQLPTGIQIHGNTIRIVFMYRGERCREILRDLPVTKSNIKFAERKRAAVLHDITVGTFDYGKHFPGSSRAKKFLPVKSQKTVKELLDEWLFIVKERYEKSTLDDYESAIRCYLEPDLGNYYANELSTIDIEKWRAGLTLSNKRKNNIFIPLRSAFELAQTSGIIKSNALSTIRNLPVDAYGGVDPFNRAEIQALLGCMQGADKNMFDYAFWSGVRSSELIAVGWEDFDWTARTVHIQRAYVRGQYKDPKTQAGNRIIELVEPAYEALLRQRAITGNRAGKDIIHRTRSGKLIKQHLHFIFYDERTQKLWKRSTNYAQKIWIPAIEKAQLRYRYTYQTRHTYASQMLMTGANPAWIAKQMGHEDWGMIRKTYAKWIPSERSTQVDRVNSILRQAAAI